MLDWYELQHLQNHVWFKINNIPRRIYSRVLDPVRFRVHDLQLFLTIIPGCTFIREVIRVVISPKGLLYTIRVIATWYKYHFILTSKTPCLVSRKKRGSSQCLNALLKYCTVHKYTLYYTQKTDMKRLCNIQHK